MLGMFIDGDVTVFGTVPYVQNSSTLTKDYSYSEEEENNLSSFISTLVIADKDVVLLTTFE